MREALNRVSRKREEHDAEALSARRLQARHIVDAIHGRYSYQLKRGRTNLTFGEWLLEKRNLQGTYAKHSAETALWLYAGIVYETLADTRYRLFHQQQWATDWLTPLVQEFINRRVKEEFYVIRVTPYTVPFRGQQEALASLTFTKRAVPSRLTNS